MKYFIAVILGLVLNVQTNAIAQDPPGLSPNVCTCVPDSSPLLYQLQVYNAQGYPDRFKYYGPYTLELCLQAATQVCK